MFVKEKILNSLIISGTKKTSEILLLRSLKLIQKQSKKNPQKLLKKSVTNTAPILGIKNIKRKRKKPIEFPFIITRKHRILLGIKHLTKDLKKKSIVKSHIQLNKTITMSVKNLSNDVKNKKLVYEHALLKKKFANYRWF